MNIIYNDEWYCISVEEIIKNYHNYDSIFLVAKTSITDDTNLYIFARKYDGKYVAFYNNNETNTILEIVEYDENNKNGENYSKLLIESFDDLMMLISDTFGQDKINTFEKLILKDSCINLNGSD